MYLTVLPFSIRFCLILSKIKLANKIEQDGKIPGTIV